MKIQPTPARRFFNLLKVESDKKSFALTTASIILLLSFTAQKFTASKATAEVNQAQGLYIFTDSKPVTSYEYLGSVNTAAVVWKTRGYQDTKDVLIKKIKKDYPQAEGIIFYFDGGKDKADAIKFK